MDAVLILKLNFKGRRWACIRWDFCPSPKQNRTPDISTTPILTSFSGPPSNNTFEYLQSLPLLDAACLRSSILFSREMSKYSWDDVPGLHDSFSCECEKGTACPAASFSSPHPEMLLLWEQDYRIHQQRWNLSQEMLFLRGTSWKSKYFVLESVNWGWVNPQGVWHSQAQRPREGVGR